MKFFGLKNCDTCRKALKELQAADISPDVVDVRADGFSEEDVQRWLGQIEAEKLVNKRSTTWRELSESEREKASGNEVAKLLVTHPTLVKRPVIEHQNAISIGWTPAVKESLGL